MTKSELITTILVFAAAGVLLFLGIRQFLGRGKPLNNAYLFATETERATMDQKPYYRQSAVVFCLLSLLFVIVGLSIVLRRYWIGLLEIPLAAAVVVYAIVSTVRIGKQAKNQP